ncbi:LLM class flavin-dependent oxidoreductase [Thermus thermamylovorans]|uniref:LLM class flavin-dependent oxidoreductase n=1 Tax=Thermus thermamylovorans TaxID=2509362 RepID=UPI001F15A935|nr:LLM class flavin-dependent oxidoreductase [Thermus thermamylovorans]
MGLAVFAVGEPHREGYAVSAPAVVLAALAARTRRIRLASAAVALGSEDPVRVPPWTPSGWLPGAPRGRRYGRGSWVCPWSWPSSGGSRRFLPIAEPYREAARGHTPRLAPAAHGFLAEEDGEALCLAAPAFLEAMRRLGRGRGRRPLEPRCFARPRGLAGADCIGDPLRAVEKALCW